MTLHDELQTIDGVGPKTAEKIERIVADHGGVGGTAVDPSAVAYAIDQARRGNEDAVIAFLETLR